jgi:Flp pilus assembly CpaF family ATPase
MNLGSDVKRMGLSFLTEISQKGLLPSFLQLQEYLDIEFTQSWRLLLSEEDLLNWFNTITNQDFIEVKNNLEEILIHSNLSVIEIKNSGHERTTIKLTQEELDLSFEILCIREKVDWNELNPFVSFNSILKGRKLRISLINKCLSCEHSHKASIRFHSDNVHPISSFFNTEEEMIKIQNIYLNKFNILICGATGSGKTSFISSLISNENSAEHLFIIEDTKEIASPTQSTTRLLSKDQHGHSLSDYCSYALRMRPDRIIVGEVRSKEVTPLILNANNGHKGLLSSLHSNSASTAPQRLSTLLCLYSGIEGMSKDVALDLICSGIDYIIFLESKKVTQAIKLLNFDNGSIHFDDILKSENEYDLDLQALVS